MKQLRYRSIIFACLISVLSIFATTLGFLYTTGDLAYSYFRPLQVAHYRLLLQNYYKYGGEDEQLDSVFQAYVLTTAQESNPLIITDDKGVVLFNIHSFSSRIDLDAYSSKYPVALSLSKQLWIVYPFSAATLTYQLLESGKFSWIFVLILLVLIVCGYFGITVASQFEKLMQRARDRDDHPDSREDDAFSREVNDFIGSIKKETLTTAEHIEKLKQFNATIAHELRNQLNTITVAVDMLQYKSDVTSEKTVAVLQGEIRQITRLVNDLHLLSLIEVQRLVVTPHPMPMNAVVEYIVSAARSRSAPVSVRYMVAADAEGLSAYIDEERFRQALDNLIDNAIRHSEADSAVCVELSRSADDCLITVQDEGSGIPAEEIDNLFRRFYRASNARGKGTGLGLAIAHEIINAHCGNIRVQSTLGVGTSFEIRLPVAIQVQLPAMPEDVHRN